MKKHQTEKGNTGCFSWLVRLKRSVNERWAKERNTFMKKFHKDNGKSLAADKLLNETGTPDLLITKVPLSPRASPTHQGQTTEPLIRGFYESNQDALHTEGNVVNDNSHIVHSVVVEPDNEGALAIRTDPDSAPMISDANDNNIRLDVIQPETSAIINGLSGSDFNSINVFITCHLASWLDQQDSVFGEVAVALTQDEYGAPVEYCGTVSMF